MAQQAPARTKIPTTGPRPGCQAGVSGPRGDPLLLAPVRPVPLLAVPGHPAAGGEEAGTLALGLKLLAAALTSPSFRPRVMPLQPLILHAAYCG
jgi:hypothetical protein